MSCHVFGVVKKFSMNKGVSSLFHYVSTYTEEIIENKIFLKVHFNEQIIMEFGPTFGIVTKLLIRRI